MATSRRISFSRFARPRTLVRVGHRQPGVLRRPWPAGSVSLVLILLAGVLVALGAIDGALDRDCEAGFFTAFGTGMRALAYVAFIEIPLVAVYYAALAGVGILIAALGLAQRLFRSG